MINMEEMKKLPNEEKRRIIDELEASIEGEEDEPELLEEMERRLAGMRSGKDKGYTREEAEAVWKKTLETHTR